MSLHDLQQPTCSTVVAAASQPVPPDLVDALAERPWRTGLEPAEEVDMLEVPADCIEVRIGLVSWQMLPSPHPTSPPPHLSQSKFLLS